MNNLQKELNQFCEDLKFKKASTYTVRNYRHAVRDFLNWVEFNYPKLSDTHDLKGVHLKYYIRLLSIKISNRTVANRLSALRTFFKWLSIHEKIDNNIFAAVYLPKFNARLPRFLSPQDTVKLLETPYRMLIM